MRATALFLLLISSTGAFLRAPVAPSRINHTSKQPACAFPGRPSHLGTNDGLRVTSDNVVDIRGGGDSPPSIIAKSGAFVSKNFFLIGMAVAVSFAKLLPEVSAHMWCRWFVIYSGIFMCIDYRLPR